MHGVAIRFSMMEFILAACCFIFPVWALSLQSYEGEREDDLDFFMRTKANRHSRGKASQAELSPR